MTIGLVPNIGPLELAIVLAIVILVLGPKRIPATFRSLTEGFRNLRDSVGDGGEDETPKLPADQESEASRPGSAEKDKSGS